MQKENTTKESKRRVYINGVFSARKICDLQLDVPKNYKSGCFVIEKRKLGEYLIDVLPPSSPR